MLRCDRYGYEGMEGECGAPDGVGYLSIVFFVAFQIIGALILLSLFIGVVTTAMAEAQVDRALSLIIDPLVIDSLAIAEAQVDCALSFSLGGGCSCCGVLSLSR